MPLVVIVDTGKRWGDARVLPHALLPLVGCAQTRVSIYYTSEVLQDCPSPHVACARCARRQKVQADSLGRTENHRMPCNATQGKGGRPAGQFHRHRRTHARVRRYAASLVQHAGVFNRSTDGFDDALVAGLCHPGQTHTASANTSGSALHLKNSSNRPGI